MARRDVRPGSNAVNVVDEIGGKQVTDSVTWNAPDAHAGLLMDRGALVGPVLADGQHFGSDNFFTKREPKLLGPTGWATRDAKPVIVAVSDNPELFRAYREGAFSYDLPLPVGRWIVAIDTFEPDAALAATRSFDVLLGGRVVARTICPSKAAGGPLRSASLSFPAEVTDGHLRLEFRPIGGPAIVAAIRVIAVTQLLAERNSVRQIYDVDGASDGSVPRPIE